MVESREADGRCVFKRTGGLEKHRQGRGRREGLPKEKLNQVWMVCSCCPVECNCPSVVLAMQVTPERGTQR